MKSGFVLMKLSLGLIIVWIALMGCPPPGKGGKAEKGFQRAQTVINALAAYRVDHDIYPETLGELIPEYLKETDLAPPVDPNYPFEYERTQQGYRLSFKYTGPGMNECRYTPEAEEWDCHGYY